MKPHTPIALKKMGVMFKSAREELNLSQAQVSEMTGIKQQYLSKLEKGEINFTFDTLITFCTGLNINPVIMLLGKKEYAEFMSGIKPTDKGLITFN